GRPEAPPGPEESGGDETAAEELFASLLVEIQPSPPAETAEGQSAPDVEETRPSSVATADTERIPVIATPAETEGRKMIRVSGRMVDGVTYASVGVLLAVFIFSW